MQRLTHRLPPFNALMAFEAAARHRSLTRAADELCITQGAVSQRVKQLEAFLDVTLFLRRGNRIELTDEAHAYLPLVGGVFETLKRGTETLFRQRESAQLTLRANHSFTEYWLIPRLEAFQRRHPGVHLRVLPHNQTLPEEQTEVDLEIINGYGDWSGREFEKLAEEHWVVVASPRLLAQHPPFCALSELARYPKIECVGYRESWLDWFRLQGHRGGFTPATLQFGNSSLAISAALGGHGFLLVRQAFVGDLIRAGRLRLAHDFRMPSSSSHYLLVARDKRHSPLVQEFCAWLREELATARSPAPRLPDVSAETATADP